MNISTKNIQDSKESYFTASQSQLIWARFKKQRAAMIAAGVLGFIIFIGIFAPAISPTTQQSRVGTKTT